MTKPEIINVTIICPPDLIPDAEAIKRMVDRSEYLFEQDLTEPDRMWLGETLGMWLIDPNTNVFRKTEE